MKSSHLRLLSRGQVRLLLFVLAGSALLLADSAYLVITSRLLGIGSSPSHLPRTYQALLLLHVVVGLLLLLPALAFAVWHLRKAMRKRRRGTLPTGVIVILTVAVLAVTGLFILTAANSEANEWAFVSHQVAAALLPLMYLVHRLLGRDRLQGRSFRIGLASMLVALAVMGGIHALETWEKKPRSDTFAGATRNVPDVWRRAPIHDPFVPFHAAADVSPDSPFWPSAATTSTGGFLPARIIHHDDFPDREAFLEETRRRGFAPNWYLGAQTCERCHPDIVEQWADSAHRFASFNNPFYKKAVELTRETVGKKESQWCGGCHDPAVMLAGNMTKEIDPAVMESQAALTCLACHAIDRIHDQTGNGNYNIQDEVPSPYVWFDAKAALQRQISDFIVKSKPNVHKRRMLKSFFRESDFCTTCHKVNLDIPLNGYKWLRGQDEYDAWHDSGTAHNSPTTWYEPDEVKSCQDCHMPLEPARLGDVSAKDGLVRSHRFYGPNTALPAIRGDADMLRRIREFRKDSVSVDVFALHHEDGRIEYAPGEQPLLVRPGETVQVDVVVRNKGVGHTFPGGTMDSNQGWIDFTVSRGGEPLLRSGALGPDRRVDPAAHFYQAVFVDKEGRRIDRRNAPDIRALVYSNVIPPSGSDIARYRFRIPEDADGAALRLSASLMWRKFNRGYTEFVYEGKTVPDLPVDVLARGDVAIRVSAGTDGAPPDGQQTAWQRHNDYGIGLFLDGDTRGAHRAFEIVARLRPDRVDGWRNQARVFLRDGNLERAEAMLKRAQKADPDDPKTAFFWGRALEESGRLRLAAEAYRQVLRFYPRSRGTWAQLGQTWWRMGRYRDCIKAYLEVLRIDPENADAHHKRSLAYQALAAAEHDERRKRAYEYAQKEAERAYLKYKDDETGQEFTREYRLKHPHDNRMSQPIVIHELVLR